MASLIRERGTETVFFRARNALRIHVNKSAMGSVCIILFPTNLPWSCQEFGPAAHRSASRYDTYGIDDRNHESDHIVDSDYIPEREISASVVPLRANMFVP